MIEPKGTIIAVTRAAWPIGDTEAPDSAMTDLHLRTEKDDLGREGSQ